MEFLEDIKTTYEKVNLLLNSGQYDVVVTEMANFTTRNEIGNKEEEDIIKDYVDNSTIAHNFKQLEDLEIKIISKYVSYGEKLTQQSLVKEKPNVSSTSPEGWKYYVEPTLGLSFSYPGDWEKKRCSEADSPNKLYELCLVSKDYVSGFPDTTDPVYPNRGLLVVIQAFNNTSQEKVYECPENTPECKNIKVGAIPAAQWAYRNKRTLPDKTTITEISTNLYKNNYFLVIFADYPEPCTFKPDQSGIYGLYCELDDAKSRTIDQMISTFKFQN